ncbi:MAG: 2,3-diphosphoglycerate synthetase [Acidimicrobiia bacterium]
MSGALVLIDGEHQPEVIEAHLARMRASGSCPPVVALFLGGFEKTGTVPRLSVPVLQGPARQMIPQAVDRFGVTKVLDLSDEPVVDARSRFALAGYALAAGVTYSGGGIDMTPPLRPRLTRCPTVAVIGTGKRTGKTSVSIALARHWKEKRLEPCIVTMGRGGPDRPLVLSVDGELPESVLDRLLAEGLHATSDYVEDALFAGVDTVGTRRLGAGPAGVTVDDDFAAGVAAATELDPGVVLLEGSGTAIPPAHADATVLVTSSAIDPEFLDGYFGPFRLALTDAVVVVGEGTGLSDRIQAVEPGLPVFTASLRPDPTTSVEGRQVVVVSTADASVGPQLLHHLRQLGAAGVQVIHSLGDRRVLVDELSHLAQHHLVLTEVKGAAAAVVLPLARAAGAEIGFIHNQVRMEGGIEELAGLLEERWTPAPQSTTSRTRRMGSRRIRRRTRS